MSAIVKEEQFSWTEQELMQAVIKLKEGQNNEELKKFLYGLIESSDSCCRSNRGKLWNELGLAMLAEEGMGDAEQCFSEALKIDPLDVSAVYNQANIALHQDSFDKAIGLYERALLIEPDFIGALFNLGLCFLYSHQYKAAQPCFEGAATLQPDNHSANYWAAETFLRTESFNEALPYFKQAYKLSPEHFETISGYAMALHGAGSYEQAISVCDNSLMSLGPSVIALRTKADAMIALNRMHEAALCHLDIAHIDLDARDTIVSRLQALHLSDPEKFSKYKDFMLDRSPGFEPLLSVIRQYGDVA